MSRPIVVAVTGASGAVYARRLLEVLVQADREVHLTISPSGAAVWRQELDQTIDLRNCRVGDLLRGATAESLKSITYHQHDDYFTPIASGSFLTGGMVVCPCSGSTLSGIATAASRNLIQRAAEVHLKEGRRLILVPRETPLSLLQLENMATVCRAGATVLPAAPGWYHGVQSLEDLVDFVVARILDQLEVPHQLMRRWGSDAEEGTSDV